MYIHRDAIHRGINTLPLGCHLQRSFLSVTVFFSECFLNAKRFKRIVVLNIMVTYKLKNTFKKYSLSDFFVLSGEVLTKRATKVYLYLLDCY